MDANSLKQNFNKTIENLDKELSGVRSSKLTPSFLDSVRVEAYGSTSKLSQLANVTILDNQTLSVQPWDKSNIKAIEKGINLANLGVSMASEVGAIRISVPMLTQERRKQLVQISLKYGEQAKIAIRNIRRDAISDLKKQDKIPEDLLKKQTNEIDKLTEEYIKKIDIKIKDKEEEIQNR